MTSTENQVSNRRTILTYGTFDLFHVGHLRLLMKLKDMGDKLIVGISTDKFNQQKGKKSFISFAHRKEIVENIKCVDLVIPEDSWEQKIDDIREYEVDVFAIGKDWEGKFDNLKVHCEVVYLDRTKGISSTMLKKTLKAVSVSKDEILNAFEDLERLTNDFE